MKKQLFLLLFFLISGNYFSQEKTINNYQYFIVNTKFGFLKERDQYQTSSLTKFLFNKAGFLTFLNDETLPKEVSDNKCNALFIEVKDVSSMLSIKSRIEIKDCYGFLLFKSEEGLSKIKTYKRGYQEAIREAFASVKELEYNYIPIKSTVNKPKVNINTTVNNNTSDLATEVLYAQSITNGFQLVNLTPEIMYHILKTEVVDFFILKDKNGILYKKNEIWIAEFYEGDSKTTKQYQIKF